MTCLNCGKSLEHMKASARYCDGRCRGEWRRRPLSVPVETSNLIAQAVAATMADCGVAETPLAGIGNALAVQLDSGATPPGALAAVCRQLLAVLEQAEGLKVIHSPVRDKIDELRARGAERSRRLANGDY